MALYQVTQTTENGNGDTVGTVNYAILQANQLPGDNTISINYIGQRS
ncbi:MULTISPECIES: hypothetical protein [Nostoc]|uniref:Uncharacterized protein n=2 Tax=Nostoc TaxID=1177 RepID=A0ABR8IKD5_9NOSO|nr:MULTISPECIES: hypothetical protein [Nostoc]MBD2565783.1 hypothetical protein [Nostoc linckia FACHB-391]MBD2651402.1 hypothetical protein [Nostoc foliaceum FACHB-393]